MESNLNLNDLIRIKKALLVYKETVKNEEVPLTQYTIDRIDEMGLAQMAYLKEEFGGGR